jgi:transketolase
VLYDDNQVTIDGPTSWTFSEDVPARFRAQGWHVDEIDGEDTQALDRALAAAAGSGKPALVKMRTTIGHGSPWAGKSKVHGGPFGEEVARETKGALGIPLEPTFLVPDAVAAYGRERAAAKRAEREEADTALAAWRLAHAAAAHAWEAVRERRVPSDFGAKLSEGLDGKADATRKHSGAVLARIAALAPGLLSGGSAALAGSNNTTVKDCGAIGLGDAPFAGATVHFGVREHAMAAITNGIALEGTFLPYAGTFLVFSDYMRPSLRLAALMGVRSAFVFTHDSIFVGEDGPTHQPIEQLDALRAFPGLTVIRPADGVEAALAWAWIVERASGPVALALTRQNVAALKRELPFSADAFARGAYLLREPAGEPDAVLIASGSEVSLACEAAELLASDGIAVRVVSAPSLDLFANQPASYRDELLPSGVPVVAVEAGRGESWRGLVGREGLVYGIDRFGASAPYQKLAEYFGFTPDALAKRVRQQLRG